MEVDKINKLTLELSMLFRILQDSINLNEYENGINSHQVYLCEIIERKITDIRNLF